MVVVIGSITLGMFDVLSLNPAIESTVFFVILTVETDYKSPMKTLNDTI
jgi:hypothetical protein